MTANERLLLDTIEDNLKLSRRNVRLLNRANAYEIALVRIVEDLCNGKPKEVARAALLAGIRYPVHEPK